ncbi:hypothetical protein DFH27DRAFT_366310 [Peziza echinospora]|nr:hypothetical protein DFH27DRAFT_366310 [Peziza echinospora]
MFQLSGIFSAGPKMNRNWPRAANSQQSRTCFRIGTGASSAASLAAAAAAAACFFVSFGGAAAAAGAGSSSIAAAALLRRVTMASADLSFDGGSFFLLEAAMRRPAVGGGVTREAVGSVRRGGMSCPVSEYCEHEAVLSLLPAAMTTATL